MIEKSNISIGNKESKVIHYTMLLDNGNWFKYEYNTRGKDTYYEGRGGYWHKKKYDDKNNIIYYETSSHGILRDDRKN